MQQNKWWIEWWSTNGSHLLALLLEQRGVSMTKKRKKRIIPKFILLWGQVLIIANRCVYCFFKTLSHFATLQVLEYSLSLSVLISSISLLIEIKENHLAISLPPAIVFWAIHFTHDQIKELYILHLLTRPTKEIYRILKCLWRQTL